MLVWQHRNGTELRAEIALRRAQTGEQTRLQAEHRRLISTSATAEELAVQLAERAAVTQLRAELDALRRRASESTAGRSTEGSTQPQPTPLLAGNVLAYKLWKNRGTATPAAAFETALWASAGGDIDALAGLLTLDPAAQTEAAALFARLPEQLRSEFVSPERLVAVLTAKDVPLGSATILGQYPSPTDTKVSALIFDAAGNQKISLFSLRLEGGRWHLVVPGNAVKRYATWLQAPPAVVQAKP
jgi:hypothetical protein